MRGFDPSTPATRLICRTNAVLALPYLAAAAVFGAGLAERRGMDALPTADAPADFLLWNAWGGTFTGAVTLAFLLFYLLFVYGLFRIKSWSRWLVLADAIGGYLFVMSFPLFGVHRTHPAQAVYAVVLDLSPHLGGESFLWSIMAGKAITGTFNLLYFFGGPLFRLADRHRAAHLLWVVPSFALLGFVTYVVMTFSQFQSPLARHRAEQQFRTISCGDVRAQHGRDLEFTKANERVLVRFNYDFTSVMVGTAGNEGGMSGGPAWFCRPPRHPMDDRLVEAAERGDTAAAIDALDGGADVDAESHFGWTPLMFAAWKGHREVFDALLARGANPDAHDKLHESVLLICAREGRTNFAQTLLERGADVNAVNVGGFTALMNAAESGHVAVVKLLLAHGANVNAENRDGLKASSMAERDGHADIVQILRDAGKR